MSRENLPTRLAVVGAGGLAHGALAQICSQLSPIPLHIRIIDDDRIERSNLNRQIFFDDSDLGAFKAEILSTRLTERFPHPQLILHGIRARLGDSNVAEFLADTDYVIDATDSVRTKLLINDYCLMQGIPFCYAGLSGDRGLLLPVYSLTDGACLRCAFPDLSQATAEQQELTCQAQGVVGANVGVVGAVQGEIFLKWLAGIKIDGLMSFSFNPIRFNVLHPPLNLDCPMHAKIRVLDLTKDSCPRTFLFTKLALEDLAEEERLVVKFSTRQSAENVKRSCETEGFNCSAIHVVTDEVNEIYELTIAKSSNHSTLFPGEEQQKSAANS